MVLENKLEEAFVILSSGCFVFASLNTEDNVRVSFCNLEHGINGGNGRSTVPNGISFEKEGQLLTSAYPDKSDDFHSSDRWHLQEPKSHTLNREGYLGRAKLLGPEEQQRANQLLSQRR